jgi:positive regulator of sigma E activity
MKETGKVTVTKGSLATVLFEYSAECESCSGASCSVSRRSLDTWNRDGLELGIGDRVEVEVDASSQLRGALLVFGLPLLLFFAGYAAGKILFPGVATEAPAAFGGLAGIGLGILAGLAASGSLRGGRRQESLPRITRVLARG